MDPSSLTMKDTSNPTIPGSEGTLANYEAADQCDDTHYEFVEMTNKISPTKSLSISQCRYCYQEMDRAASVSNCHCNGCLCHSCLVKEVALTYNRGTNVTACTVCQKEYTLTTHHHWNWKRDCPRFCRQLKCCGLRQDEFIMDTTTGILGYGFVLIGITLWIICSGIIFTLPPHRLPLFVYYLLGSFD